MVTPRSGMPQGTMSEYGARSLATLNAKPWEVTHREMRTPMAPILSRPTQQPVRPATRSASTPKSRQVRIITSSRSRT